MQRHSISWPDYLGTGTGTGTRCTASTCGIRNCTRSFEILLPPFSYLLFLILVRLSSPTAAPWWGRRLARRTSSSDIYILLISQERAMTDLRFATLFSLIAIISGKASSFIMLGFGLGWKCLARWSATTWKYHSHDTRIYSLLPHSWNRGQTVQTGLHLRLWVVRFSPESQIVDFMLQPLPPKRIIYLSKLLLTVTLLMSSLQWGLLKLPLEGVCNEPPMAACLHVSLSCHVFLYSIAPSLW